MSLEVVSWNVLHRIHAENWQEVSAKLYSDEQRRGELIADRVARWFDSGVAAICLQEVSGDQLAALQARCSKHATFFEHCYPRIPALKSGGPGPLSDPRELLVTIAGAGAELLARGTSEHDPGKGFLSVRLANGVELTNAHVSFGSRGDAQLRHLAALATASKTECIVVGDFNRDLPGCRELLEPALELVEFSVDRPTRVVGDGHPGKWIDHIGVRGLRVLEVGVTDAEGASDHNPVYARMTHATLD